MISNQQQYEGTIARITRFREIVEGIRRAETNPSNYRASAGGFIAEIDRMQLEVREYLMFHPSELCKAG